MKYIKTISFGFLLTLLMIVDVQSQSLTVYSGRSKALVEPLIEEFEQETGIRMNVRYGSSTQLAVALMEEGRRTPADVFWAQDAGALGAVHQAGLLQPLPPSSVADIPSEYRNAAGTWVATSGRARVLAYSSHRVDKERLPESVYDLVQPEWAGRVGWAPANGSFQSFLTSMRLLDGNEKTLEWLENMKNNNARSYINNSALLQAISAGEIDLALTNHYYLYRFKENNPDYPVAQIFFKAGDPGNLINVAGLGILASSQKTTEAEAFIHFLLKPENQQWVADEIFEYPVHPDIRTWSSGRELEHIQDLAPSVDLDDLSSLEQTLTLLRRAGLL
ncbi:iron ABC transporter substrate-binding protein [Balneolaceae bacterium ANBcel3]|nr:iron ABC transporter substrate-binding protein [Balneolaceae bacterium ANBcel3]